jgi:hypothetical protein
VCQSAVQVPSLCLPTQRQPTRSGISTSPGKQPPRNFMHCQTSKHPNSNSPVGVKTCLSSIFKTLQGYNQLLFFYLARTHARMHPCTHTHTHTQTLRSFKLTPNKCSRQKETSKDPIHCLLPTNFALLSPTATKA